MLVVAFISLASCEGQPAEMLDEPDRTVIIDAHVHLFNATDVPIEGFFSRSVVGHRCGYGAGCEMLKVAARFLLSRPGRRMRLKAPTAREEIEGGADLLDRAESPDSLRALLYEFVSQDSTSQAILRGGNFEPDLLDRGSQLEALAEFVGYFTRSRLDNLDSYFNKFEADVVVAATIDMASWVSDSVESSFADQDRTAGWLARESGGVVLPFTGYDPISDLSFPNGEPVVTKAGFERVKTAIRRHGAVGIKLYPVMGFSPAANSVGEAAMVDVPPCPRAQQNRCKELIDGRMHEILSWAASEGVPVMAHANNSLGAQNGSRDLASPEYWALALTRVYEETGVPLRLNLGHFGGTEDLLSGFSPTRCRYREPQPGRPEQFEWSEFMAAMPLLYPEAASMVFFDFGDFSELLSYSSRIKYFNAILALQHCYPTVQDRLLYATDWFMLSNTSGYETYQAGLLDMMTGAQHTGLPAMQPKFFGGNAATYLGLNAGDSTRSRLIRFYGGSEPPVCPDWLFMLPGSIPSGCTEQVLDGNSKKPT